ncbi:MAG TPA: hypothetical protein VE441_09450, partial [Mycobacterium sp.]|nr:hypothetical protein [Mycobacterium sp.]
AGTGNTATANLTVVAPPEVSTEFTDATGGGSPDWINLGDTATVDIGVDNPNTDAQLTGVALTDTLPTGLVVANPSKVITGGSCGTDAVSAVPGSHTVGLSGVTLAPGPTDPSSQCAVVVAVTGVRNGLQTNTTGVVTSNEGGDAAPATASIGVFGSGPRIYWGATLSGAASGLVQFARLDGSVAATLGKHDGSGGVEGTAIDAAAGRLYWIDAANSRVSWSAVDDSTHGSVSVAGATLTAPAGLTIDPPDGLIYWANEGGTHPISYAHLDGTGGGNLITAGASTGVAAGPALDLAQQRIYWADPTADKISYAHLDGSGGGDVVTTGATVNSPSGVAIDAAGGRIYWANAGDDSISYADLDGSGGADLDTTGTTVLAPSGIAVDPSTGTVYWTNQDSAGSISYALSGGGGGELATPGVTPTAPSYPSLLYPPQAVGTVTVTGAGKPGATLTCSATWAPDLLGSFLYRAPQTVAYQWQRDGVNVSGANATTLNAPSDGTYTCRVTAGNASGSTAQISAGHQVATLSAVKITNPVALFQPSSKITVAYSASDSAGASAVRYDVQYRTAMWDGGFPTTWSTLAPDTTSASKSVTGAAGYEYCFRVRAHDTAGNTTAWATRCTELPLDDRALRAANTGWSRVSSTGSYYGTLTTTTSQGAKLKLTGVQLDRFALVVTECATCGQVGIYLGGTLWTTVNTYASTTRKHVIRVSGQFALRTTTVVLRAMSADKKVLIDGFGAART